MEYASRTKGIAAITASAFGFALMAAFVRLADDYGAPISSFQKSFFRNIVAFMIALAVFVRARYAARARGTAVGAVRRRLPTRALLVLLLRSGFLLGEVCVYSCRGEADL